MDRAYNDHAEAPQAFADALMARAATLPADAEGAEAIRLAEHVMLGHLADAPALQRFVQALPPALVQAEVAAASLQRANGCLSLMQGGAPADLPPLLRWRSLHNAVLGLALTGRAALGSELLARDEAAALASPELAERQAYAAAANNIAAGLRQEPRRSADVDALMIQAAGVARRAWEKAGNWMNVERAEYQLALCHAVLGQGTPALHHAGLCLRICEAEQADAVEHFFAHEALVHAHRAAGQADQACAHRAQMAQWLPQVADAGMQAYCAKTLADTPA
jgi:hypothetical protein